MSTQQSKNSIWNKTWKRTLYGYLLINGFIWIFSPFIANYYLSSFLEDQYQMALSENSQIRFNPFTSHLSIKLLSISKEGVEVMKIGMADFEIRIHRLIALQLYISEFQVGDLSALVAITEHGIIVSGVEIDKLATETENEIKAIENLEEKSGLTIIIPKISINKSGIQLDLKKNRTTYNFKAEQFLINDITISNTEQLLTSNLEGNFNGAKYKIDLEVKLENGKGTIKNKIKLKEFDISNLKQFIPTDVQQLSGMLNINTSNTIEVSPQSVEISAEVLEVENNDFKFKDSRFSYNQRTQKLIIKGLHTKIKGGEKNIALKSFSIVGSEFKLSDDEFELNHLGQTLSINDVGLTQFVDNSVNLFIENMVLSSDGLALSTKAMSFTQNKLNLILDKISYDKNDLTTIHLMALERLNGVIKRKNNNARIESSAKVSEENVSEEIVSQESLVQESKIQGSTIPSNQIRLVIDKIALSNSEKLVFSDQSISPEYQTNLIFDKFEIRKINSLLPQQSSPFEINARSGKYSKFNFKGHIQPFTKLVNLKLEGELNEVSLPPANGYIQQTMGFQFKHGELDTIVDVEVKDSNISGNTEIKIRGLEMDSAENYDQDSIQKQTALPLNVALGMLKDGDDNVLLNIPMLGNVDSPSFGVSSFIGVVTKNAIQAAAKNYIIKTFIPYAELLTVTISAGSFIMKTRFEDLPYNLQQIDISSEQTDYMNQFIALMKEKTETQIKVCASATMDELSAQEIATLEQSEKVAALQQLSKSRMESFKDFVVKAGIESSRILLCSPKIDINRNSLPILSLTI